MDNSRFRVILAYFMLLLSVIVTEGRNIVVADSITRIPLPNASVSDRNGVALGKSDNKGRLPLIPQHRYPITVSFLGFNDTTVTDSNSDTIYMSVNVSELPEFVVETKSHRVLHILAYVREYSTLTTYTDTVFMFREKMVDYMLPSDPKVKFNGWTIPRPLSSKSYYHFSNLNGLDSVSDVSRHHFSWSDWISLPPEVSLPNALVDKETATDTLKAKYGKSEIWNRTPDGITVDIDVLSDRTNRKWVPYLNVFFRKNLDFDKFKVKYSFNNITGDNLSELDLTGYTFDIESRGRGHEMFLFNKVDEPFFVSTQAEVFVIDKEYISVKEARRWDKRDFDIDQIGIYQPSSAPELSPDILALIDRVDNIDQDSVRLGVQIDPRIVSSKGRHNINIGNRVLSVLKQLTGISRHKFNKNFNNNWKSFKNNRRKK